MLVYCDDELHYKKKVYDDKHEGLQRLTVIFHVIHGMCKTSFIAVLRITSNGTWCFWLVLITVFVNSLLRGRHVSLPVPNAIKGS